MRSMTAASAKHYSNIIITILDGYIDEPACLGVPPFIAPLPRYVFGAIKTVDKNIQVNYLTIDEYRLATKTAKKCEGGIAHKLDLLRRSKILVLIAGAIVPGKYFRATPISLRETLDLAAEFNGIKFLGGACAKYGFGQRGRAHATDKLNDIFDYICKSDLDATIFEYLSADVCNDRLRTGPEWQLWPRAGTEVVRQHPDFPSTIIIELEAGRGCARYLNGGCAFCSEPHFGEPAFRSPEEVMDEVKHLYRLGIKHFRLGAISCIFSYFAKGIGETETPIPNVVQVEKLLKGIRSAAPDLEVLHLDNANPAVMAAHPEETGRILKIILETCTGGNVLSLGLESADPVVIKRNNLNTNPEEVELVIKLINRLGADRGETGLPMLLPGLNFIYGLTGESKQTYQLNFEFLKTILDQGLLLRRINHRQVLAMTTGTENGFKSKKDHRTFIRHKRKVREQIDRPMLMRMLPQETILKAVYSEKQVGNITFGRQLGTYPLLVGVQYKIPCNEFYDVVVTDHGFRSITGVTVPFNINRASRGALCALPGIGAKRATRLLKTRPFKTFQEVQHALDDELVLSGFEKHLSYETP